MVNLPDLEGMERTSSGLIVPGQYAGLDAKLSQPNQKFIKVRDNYYISSIAPSIMAKYLEACKRDKDGVVFYDTPKGSAEIAQKIMEELGYHLHRRVPLAGMTAELYSQLQNVEDPSGESYVDKIVALEMGINLDALEMALSKNGAGFEVILGLAGNIGQQYFHKVLGKTIHKEFGPDVVKYREGIRNMRDVLSVGAEKNDDYLVSLGLEDLLKDYVGIVDESLKKVDAKH